MNNNRQSNQTLCIEELVKQRPILTESEMSEFCTYNEIIADFKTTFDNMVKDILQKNASCTNK